MIVFEEFPKIPRLSRECIVTEKIDGTNASIIIDEDGTVAAASRTRLITLTDDNYGFARWVKDHEDELRVGLGPGRHFGEWWGQKIQRGYGLTEKRFSLFNTSKWYSLHDWVEGKLGGESPAPACCHVVPIVSRGMFKTEIVEQAIALLTTSGSIAAPGFMKPEGIVVFHTAGNLYFKKTIEKDEAPKGLIP